MKRFLMVFVMMFMTASFLNAQNYSEDPFMENDWSFKARAAYVGSIHDVFNSDGSAYLVGFEFEKMANPYVGFGPELNVALTNGADNVLINPSMNVKFNLTNVFAYNGERQLFEPSLMVGLGYTLITEAHDGVCISPSARAGFDFTFNFGKNKEFAIMLSPRFYCVDLNDFNDSTMLELGIGFIHHF